MASPVAPPSNGWGCSLPEPPAWVCRHLPRAATTLEKPNKFDPFGQKESAHLIYHTIAPLKVLVMGVNFILPF